MNPDLGPLKHLIGTWEGNRGEDVSPSPDLGIDNNVYREQIIFEDIGLIDNHQQLLQGLRYTNTVWEPDVEKPFHQELGYWLWDPAEKQVMKCFTIPRGVSVLAGGSVEPDATSFDLEANVGSETYGICSNNFLDKEFKTTRYELNVVIHNENSFSYNESMFLSIKGKNTVFHHSDKNTLFRVA